TANAVYGYFPAAAEGNDVRIFADAARDAERARFHFLRQQQAKPERTQYASLADLVAPVGDHLGAFAVTTGLGADELADRFKQELDDYSAILTKALADRLAEALAEM